MAVEVHGLDPLEGETAFAFFVVRTREPMSRDQVVEMLRYVAPLIPDPDTFIDELPEDLDQAVRILAMPWTPPEAGHAALAQRRLIESAGSRGIEAAWFFQTGTSLPTEGEADEDDDGDDDDDADDDEERRSEDTGEASMHGRARTNPERSRAMTSDDAWVGESTWNRDAVWSSGELGGDTKTTPIEIVDMTGQRDADFDEAEEDAPPTTLEEALDEAGDEEDDDEPDDEDDDEDDDDLDDDDDDDDEVSWSHGPPPQVTKLRFPVDGYPAILDELDWEDFGIAVKLRGDMLAGEGTVLFGFHALWLAPYGGRYRNAAVTIDREHHAAHLWVDRFAVPCSAEEQVHHLLWILAKLDEVVPIVHARFAGATMAQKYAGLMGDTSEPFVLGGNPLLAIHAASGEEGVDRWIAEQTEWTGREVARMLRELAIEVVTAGGDCDEPGEEVDGIFAADESSPDRVVDDEDDEGDDDDDDDGDDDDDDDDDDDSDDDDDDDDEAEGNEDEDRGRQITSYAGELLAARARAGKLDPRAAEQLLPVLETSEKFEHRRRAVVQILGALRYKPAVPALIKILDETTIKSSLDSIGKEDFVAATAAALGAIADPAAIDALSRVVAAPGTHNDEPRPVAADALASCLAAAPEPRRVDDAVLGELLTTIRERNDGELNAETQLAYGRIVHQLPADRRAEARRRLASCESARDDAIALLARQAALVLASPTSQVDAPPRDLQPLLHESLTSVDYDHDYTVRNLRVALRVAEIVPDLVDPEDLVWLTRFAEPDIRARAHALLAKLGKPLPAAPGFDAHAARELDDDALIRAIGEAHVVGRAALIAEAGRRKLERAKRAIIDACHDVVSRARQGGENLLDPDTRVLAAAIPILRELPGDDDIAALFARMQRHSNYHISNLIRGDADAEPDDEDDDDSDDGADGATDGGDDEDMN